MNDPTRAYALLSTAEGGMDNGSAPSLIRKNQYALGINLTNRGDFIHTRPPYEELYLTIDTLTAARFTGKFQGAGWYDGELGESGWIVARGGRLFKITVGSTNVVVEITPVLLIQTLADFTVPAIAASVTVSITDEAPFSTGENILIDSGSYTVTNRLTDQIVLTFNGGGPGTGTVEPAGIAVNDSLGNQIKSYREHSPDYEFIHIFQAENYAIICRNQFLTVFYDGTMARESTVNEIPPCMFGVYGMGRIWFVLDNLINYGAGDLVYGPSGTPSLGFRDSVLKVTENDFLNEGGFFGVPSSMGPITGLQFLALQDTSLGLGPLAIGTTNGVFTNQAPIDRTTWKSLTYPIQTISLFDYGPQGPRNMVSSNGDMYYRSADGERSFVVARRNFPAPGNTPISFEVSPILDNDTKSLLFFGSGILFDNRLLFTIAPHRTETGIVHYGLASLNFDLVSSLSRKEPLCWESIWSGLNILQIVKARIDQEDRGFLFVERNGSLGLWEILTDGYYDVSKTIVSGNTNLVRAAVPMTILTRSDTCDRPDDLKNLYAAELFLDELIDTTTIKVEWRPDQFPLWTTWSTLSLCTTVTQCSITPGATCTIFTPKAKGYAARIMLPQPQEFCSQTDFPIRLGIEFQFRITITGSGRLRKFRPHTKIVTQQMEGDACAGGINCRDYQDCGDSLFTYNSYGS